jgi:hypothetical protein
MGVLILSLGRFFVKKIVTLSSLQSLMVVVDVGVVTVKTTAKGKHRIKAHKRESGVGESISLKNFAKFKMIEFLDLVGEKGFKVLWVEL